MSSEEARSSQGKGTVSGRARPAEGTKEGVKDKLGIWAVTDHMERGLTDHHAIHAPTYATVHVGRVRKGLGYGRYGRFSIRRPPITETRRFCAPAIT